MNIGGVDAGKSAGSYGNLNVLPKGTVYTHGQVVLSRKFTVSGSDGSCKTKDGGTAGTATTFALGESGAGTSDLQVVYAANGTGMSTAMNSSAHKDETATGDSADGALDANDNYMKFRWALASPYAYDGINMPTMTISRITPCSRPVWSAARPRRNSGAPKTNTPGRPGTFLAGMSTACSSP